MKAQNSKSRRILALITMLFGAMIMMLPLSAYGQQEVSPSWYDPWGAPNAAVARPAKPAVAARQQARSVKSASVASSRKSATRVRSAEKLHAKHSLSRPTAS